MRQQGHANSNELAREFGVGALLAAVTWIASWSSGFRFPYSNNTFHVPIVLGAAGSAEGPHDAFHQSLDRFASYFWPIVGWFATEQNIERVFLLLDWLIASASVIGMYAIARAAGARRDAAALAAAALPFMTGLRGGLPFGGGDLLLTEYLSHSQAATALLVVCFALAVSERWRWAAFLCGLAANINCFLAAWGIVTLVGVHVTRAWRPPARGTLSRELGPVLQMSLLWLIAAAPILFWTIGDMLSAEPHPAFSYGKYLYDYFETFPLHHYALVQPGALLMYLGISVSVACTCRHFARTDGFRNLWLCLVVAFAVCALGSVLPYLTENSLVLNLHPLRFAVIVHLLSVACVITLWITFDERQRELRGIAAAAVFGFFAMPAALTALALLLFAVRARRTQAEQLILATAFALVPLGGALGLDLFTSGITQWEEIGLVVASLGFLGSLHMSSALKSLRESLAWSMLTAATLLSCVDVPVPLQYTLPATAAIAIAAFALTRTHRAHTQWVAAALALVALGSIALGMRTDPAGLRIAALVCAASLAPAAIHMLPASKKQLLPVPVGMLMAIMLLSVLGLKQGIASGFAPTRFSGTRDFIATEQWARANTPPDTLFYAPHDDGFSTLSRRPVWWSWKEGAAVMWQPSFFEEWARRRDLASGARSGAELAALARREGIDYLVLQRHRYADNDVPLQTVFANETYRVLAVKSKELVTADP